MENREEGENAGKKTWRPVALLGLGFENRSKDGSAYQPLSATHSGDMAKLGRALEEEESVVVRN